MKRILTLRFRGVAMASALALLTACAEEEEIGQSQVDAATAATSTQTASETAATTPATPKKPISKGAIIVTTDYAGSGTAAFLSLSASPDAHKLSDALELVSSDPVVRVSSGGVFVVNRFGADNIQILDPSINFKTKTQYSVGNGANPHDILVVSSTKAYVTRYEPPFDDILIVDPPTGREIGKIALGGVNGLNSTATPRPDQMVLANNKVYVLLQNIDATFGSMGSSLLAVIDPDRDALVDLDTSTAVVDAMDLGVRNAGGMFLHETSIFAAASGDYTAADPSASAGLVKVDTGNNTVTLLITGSALGGRPSMDIAITEKGKGYLAVSDAGFPATFNSYVISFDAATGVVGPKVYTGSSLTSALPEFEIDTYGNLIILDRDPEKPGVVVVDTSTDTVVKDRHALTVPPASIAVWNEVQ